MLPPGETPLPLGRAQPAPIEPTKDELKALIRRLGIEGAPSDNVLHHLVGTAIYQSEPVPAIAKIARALGHVMRRPPDHALQIMAPALKRSGRRELFGAVRRHLETEVSQKK